ncbi:unnamed protein product [Miscanthus lutarioriparius]|uniref:Transposase (putative) gypsy type domain-containing protein n=1 Tax=Miscanthus lutarioriparius TaxID=422564 RepID=A0A811S4Y6_9POAL|nr:unnamed protein product [Miscanthus lutarioriparius]
MPSSSASHSLSSVQTIDPKPASAQDTTADSSDRDDDGGGGGNARSWPATERVASYLRSQKSVHALCEKFGVNTKAFTPIPAGDRRACSPPPAGSICLYADALEAGMRVPLDPFFCEVLSHFGVAPSQLSPNCWRILAAFLALSRAAGVQLPSVPVFLHFFALRVLKVKGLYCFSPKDAAGVLFTGLPDKIKRWKEGFFFLKSSSQWPCPVLWGEPTKKSTADPVLTNEEKSAVAKLLSVRGAAPIDVLIYLSEGDLAAARMTPRAPKPPTPSPSYRATGAKGMDPSRYAMLQNMRAEKAAAEAAAAAKVAAMSEPGCSAPPGWTPLSGKKRPAEDDTKEATGHGSASVAPGFCTRQKRKLEHAPDRHDGDTVEWEAARQLLQGVITPARERAFLVADPFTVIATSYVATLQAANYATFSLGHALKLQEELEKAKAELAEAKKATAAEMKSAKAAAVQEFLGSEEHERRLVEEALKGYERGMEDMKRVALRLRPDVDAVQLFVLPGGFQ